MKCQYWVASSGKGEIKGFFDTDKGYEMKPLSVGFSMGLSLHFWEDEEKANNAVELAKLILEENAYTVEAIEM